MPAFQSSPKRKKRVSGVLVFLLAFLLFIVVFGGISLWAVYRINRERTAAASSLSSAAVTTAAYLPEDARSLLIALTDEEQLEAFVVLRSDPANTRMRTLALPRETEMEYGIEQLPLSELYRKHGIRETEEAISKMFGLSFDNYAVLSYDGLKNMINYLENGVVFTITENLQYSSEEYSIDMKGGVRTLTADQVLDVLRYPNWSSGSAVVHAQMIAAVINQYVTEYRSQRLEEDFKKFSNLCSTSDLYMQNYREAADGLQFLAMRNKSASICSAIQISGKYVVSSNAVRFIPDDDAAQKLRSVFANQGS